MTDKNLTVEQAMWITLAQIHNWLDHHHPDVYASMPVELLAKIHHILEIITDEEFTMYTGIEVWKPE